MSLSGADPDQLDAVATELRGLAAQLLTTAGALSGRVRGSTWQGPVAARFRQEWENALNNQVRAASAALDLAAQQLRGEADQQRVASGESPHGAAVMSTSGVRQVVGGIGSVLRHELRAVEHSTEHAVGAVAGAAAAAGRGLRGFADIEREGFQEVVSSAQFSEVMGGLRAAQTVASIAALIPGAQEVALPVVAALGTVIVLGDVAEMANTGKWDYGKLGVDGLSTAASFADVGAASRVASDATEALTPYKFLNLEKLPQTWGELAGPDKILVGLHAGADVVGGFETAGSVMRDLREDHYGQAVADGLELAPIAMDVRGVEGAPIAELVHQEAQGLMGAVEGDFNGDGFVRGGLTGLDR